MSIDDIAIIFELDAKKLSIFIEMADGFISG